MRIYFAGSDGNNNKYNLPLQKAGVVNRLESYFYLKDNPSLQFNLLIDSGGFTARTKGKSISVQSYAEFLNKFKIRNAFNLDTNDIEETLKNQEYLKKNCKGTYIIPIYHFSDYLEMRDLIEKFLAYSLIAVGGVAGVDISKELKDKFYSFVFYKTRDIVRVHGLGITSITDLKGYPWFSTDSTSWLAPGRYGNSLVVKDKRLQRFKNKERHYLDRVYQEIKYWLKIERDITALWEKRGVVWDN